MNRIKSYFLNFLLVIISVCFTFWICEYIYRKALFDTKNKSFDKYRQYSLYADTWDENYWKLARLWGNSKPYATHPVLGWNFKGWPKTLFHPEVQNLGIKRPVLLYGDSFAQCVDSTIHYETFLNNDSAFNTKYHFINYGTGAYGVDQIYTMFKNTFIHYKKPIVIFSFLTDDLDRSCLSFREGQKPIYEIDKSGNLNLNTSQYIASNTAYLKKHPPDITSYLWRKFLYSDANFLPENVTRFLTGESSNRKKVIKLNEKIINDVIKILRQNKTDFIFLIYQEEKDYMVSEDQNWRVRFIRRVLKQNNVNYIWAEDLIKNKINLRDEVALNNYHIENDGHPTSEFNRLLSEEIKSRILRSDFEKFDTLSTGINSNMTADNEYFYSDRLDSVINKIKSDSSLLKIMLKNSTEQKISIARAISDFAIWSLWEKEQ